MKDFDDKWQPTTGHVECLSDNELLMAEQAGHKVRGEEEYWAFARQTIK